MCVCVCVCVCGGGGGGGGGCINNTIEEIFNVVFLGSHIHSVWLMRSISSIVWLLHKIIVSMK